MNAWCSNATEQTIGSCRIICHDSSLFMKDLGVHDDGAKKALIDLVQLHARQLGEHCSTVQILVTVELEGGVEYRQYEFGVGSFLARMAHA